MRAAKRSPSILGRLADPNSAGFPDREREIAAPNSTQPLVSVIVNCYNGASFLREAIESVLAQTYPHWEIVFWDNRSTDESPSIFKRYADDRCRYFLAPEMTVLGMARNLAVANALGKWIAFLDCDDVWATDKLAQQVALISAESSDLGLVYGRMNFLIEPDGSDTRIARGTRVDSSAGIRDVLPEGRIFHQLLQENFVPLVSALVLRDAYWSVGGIDSTLKQAEDFDLFVKIANGFRARAVQEVCCTYRIHGANLSHSQREAAYSEALTVVSRYLPRKEAADALRIWRARYAGFLFRHGRYREGMGHVLAGANIFSLAKRGASAFLIALSKSSARK